MSYSQTVLPMFFFAFLCGIGVWLTPRLNRNKHPYIVVTQMVVCGLVAIQWLSLATYCAIGLNPELSESFSIDVTSENLRVVIQVMIPILLIIPITANLLFYLVAKRWFPDKERKSNKG